MSWFEERVERCCLEAGLRYLLRTLPGSHGKPELFFSDRVNPPRVEVIVKVPVHHYRYESVQSSCEITVDEMQHPGWERTLTRRMYSMLSGLWDMLEAK